MRFSPLLRGPLAHPTLRVSRTLRVPSHSSCHRVPSFTHGLCTRATGGSGSGQKSGWNRFWAWTQQERPSWKQDPVEAAVAFCVFGVTGSTSVAVVRPFLRTTIGLEGSMTEGPWSYRILSILLVSPIYATLLISFGTMAGRHRFFAQERVRALLPGVRVGVGGGR